ncbi:MAG: hypothetical protein K8S62_04970 [Candidatus Sabulitectum sp.]|nr:hypothetical protein [Candidatus Sabulitectum sp.]
MAAVFNISSSDIETGKAMAGISYFGILGFIIAMVTSRENRYVMFHSQQSLIPTILFIVRFLPGTPFFVDGIVGLAAFALFIIGLINGFNGKVQPLPLLGEFAYNFGICKSDDTEAE